MLSYKQIGNKNSKCTLVFLHGSTMTKEGMLPFAENFIEHNCIVVDLTAHGESSGEEPKEIKTFAEDVEETILKLQQDEIIGKNVVVLGYSMGGAITCEIALRKKIELSGIVILSSGGDLSNHTPLVDQLKSVPVEEFHAAELQKGIRNQGGRGSISPATTTPSTHRNRCACAQVSAAPGWNPKDSPGLVAPAIGRGATAMPTTIKMREGCSPLALSLGFFDSLSGGPDRPPPVSFPRAYSSSP